MQSYLNSQSLILGQKSMDALWLRQQVVSGNIANVDTPNYKSRTVKFEEFLKNAVNASQNSKDFKSRLESIVPKVHQNSKMQAREDGNNVNIDVENIEFVRTVYQYQSMTRAVSDELKRIKYAVSGGR